MSSVVPRCAWLALALAAPGFSAFAQDQAAVSGLAPHERPASAPIIGQFSPDLAWRSRTLYGVSEPLPPTLRFVDSHGAWYTPFDRPGMPGRYDLRGWHAPSGK